MYDYLNIHPEFQYLGSVFSVDSEILHVNAFEAFSKPWTPFQAREGFAWENHGVFITQDEIDEEQLPSRQLEVVLDIDGGAEQ